MTHTIGHEYSPFTIEGDHKDSATGLPVDLYHASGTMHCGNVTTTVTIGDSDQASEVEAGFTASMLHNVTFGGDHYLKPTLAGNYLIVWSLSADAGANDEVEGGYMVNGTAVEKGTAHSAPTAGKAMSMAASCIQNLLATDEVSLFVRNHTDGDNIVVEHGALTIVRLW